MDETVYVGIALAQIASRAIKHRRAMATLAAQSVTDNEVLDLIQAWHNPSHGLPTPAVTIPMLRKGWHGFIRDDNLQAAWNIKCVIYREIARGREIKFLA